MKVHVRMGDEHKILYALSFLVLGLVTFWYFAVYERPITNAQDFSYNDEAPVVVAFGDSLIEGVGAKTTGGFVGVLEQDLGIDIINHGVSGDTTSDAWKRIRATTKIEPDVVLISLGGNDFIQRKNRDQTEAELERIVSEIHRSGAAVILLEVPGYYGMHRSVSRTFQTAYVSNILSGLLGKEEYMFDAIHPNDTGYKKVAEKIKPTLSRLID